MCVCVCVCVCVYIYIQEIQKIRKLNKNNRKWIKRFQKLSNKREKSKCLLIILKQSYNTKF